jgi:hypothetical protein
MLVGDNARVGGGCSCGSTPPTKPACRAATVAFTSEPPIWLAAAQTYFSCSGSGP